jgi:hypothetical protein
MPTDFLLVQILLTRSEAQLLFDVLPSAKLRSKIEAFDLAIDYLSGRPRAFAVCCHVHGNSYTLRPVPNAVGMNVRERSGSGTPQNSRYI